MSLIEKEISVPQAAAKRESGSTSPTDSTLSDNEKTFIDVMSEKQQEAFPENYLSAAKYLDLEAQAVPAPKKPWYALFRYTMLDIYRRLFSIVFLANLGVFIYVMISKRKLVALVNAAAANVLACGLARQPLVVNAIFFIVCSIPRSAPLRLRRIASKVYHYGGVHSGCGIASFVWYLGFVGLLTQQFAHPPGGVRTISVAPLAISYVILALLLAIVIVAYPAFRFKMHDYFELTHRFSAWLVIALFVVLLMVFSHEASQAQNQPLGRFVIELPAFWFLMVVVASIIHPWLLLRKVRVQPEYLSNHAVRLHFDHTTTNFGKGIQLAKHPLRDWHGFATFPDPGSKTFSSLVSKAGDWTSACIQDQPTHLWKRGVLIYGFAYVMRVYKRIIVVTTGSGIGPCLSFVGDENRPEMRVVWQTRAPKKTYGQGVLDLVSQMDPDPVVIDSNKTGRVDMVPIIRRLYKDFDAEAVCVISNPFVTKKVVYELESTGTPAFGPIFDS